MQETTPQLTVQETMAARVMQAAAGDPHEAESLTAFASLVAVLTLVVTIAGCYLGVRATEHWETTDSSPEQLKTYAVALIPLLAFVPPALVLDGRLRRRTRERRRALSTWLRFAAMPIGAGCAIFVVTSIWIGLNSLVF